MHVRLKFVATVIFVYLTLVNQGPMQDTKSKTPGIGSKAQVPACTELKNFIKKLFVRHFSRIQYRSPTLQVA